MGFFTVALVVFLPLLIAGLAALSALLFVMFQKTAADRICKVEAMKLQRELSRLVKEVVRLNRPAAQLRIQRARAEEALAAAAASANPAALVAAKATLDATLVAQAALASRQRNLFVQARAARLRSERELQAKRGSAGMQEIVAISSPSLGLIPSQLGSPTPDYVAPPSFGNRQSQTYRYKQNILSRAPNWLLRFLQEDPSTRGLLRPFKGDCSATLKTEEEKWQPVLRKVSR
jgi:hypothetical protein